jgi:thiol-disulfide isomerase/thioredoxin
MKALFVSTLLFATSMAFGQTLKFKVEGLKDTTVNLIRYYGERLYYADTAEMKNGYIKFDGSKQKPGILALFLPGQKMLEFIYNNEDVTIEASYSDLMGTAHVKKSDENKVFNAYVKYINSERIIANQLVEERKTLAVNSPSYNEFTEKINQKTANVISYQKDIVANHWDKLVSRIVKMSMDVVIPEAPIGKEGITFNPNLKFLYFRQHYFDNIDLQDDRLVRTPIYHKKLENYFSKSMMIQHWDTVLHYAFDLCDQLNPKSELFQYTVSWITSSYEKSKIMGMDKVFVMMGDRYYCEHDTEGNSLAFWMKEEKLKRFCEKVNTQKKLVIGATAPNISLRDTSDVIWKDFYSLQSEYKILYFWDPNCGHCKKITPKLQVLYKRKFRDRNVELFAVGKAIGDEFEKWKNYVKKNNLEFINVAVTDKLFKAATEDARQFVPRYTTLEALNYQQTYDIYATPKMFVLDQNNKIIAKSLSVSQLEDLIDRLQNKSDLEKIYPSEDEKEDEKMN